MPILEARDISKRFDGVPALEGVSLPVRAGAVLALLGENGAGKSTLMRICYGLLRPDGGRLLWNGHPVRFADPAAARAAGIGMVHQHFTLAPAFTVAENLALTAPPPGRLTPRAMESAARRLMERTGLAVDPAARVASLPVGLQQRVEILKALSTSARVLILDEPTAVLAPAEVAELFAVLRRLRDAGTAVILITHKLPEALSLADDVAVLRRGRLVLHAPRGGVDAEALAQAMVGRSLAPPPPSEPSAPGPVLLQTPLLAAGGEGALHGGETVGVAGVEGNGQAEIVETIVGLRPGPVRLEQTGQMVDASSWDVARRIAWGLSHIPEDRHATALALSMSVRENLSLAARDLPHRGAWIDRPAERRRAAALMEEYDVRAASMDAPVGGLSGGNQQKAVVAREMSRGPRLVVAANPTRGLDVAATEFVHGALRRHRAAGGATLLVSSELDEVLGLSDRVLVVYHGSVAAEVSPREPGARERIGLLMTGAAGGAS